MPDPLQSVSRLSMDTHMVVYPNLGSKMGSKPLGLVVVVDYVVRDIPILASMFLQSILGR
jgi:hypothetical protein